MDKDKSKAPGALTWTYGANEVGAPDATGARGGGALTLGERVVVEITGDGGVRLTVDDGEEATPSARSVELSPRDAVLVGQELSLFANIVSSGSAASHADMWEMAARRRRQRDQLERDAKRVAGWLGAGRLGD